MIFSGKDPGMMNQKQQMLTEPIKRFLIQLVAKSGPKQPERFTQKR